ncbi:rhomboid family intramembrane serine protease [Ruminococcus sp. 5_1_39BFAA]|uniref:rhomboid family intramembrane serine protease n=1 Tax=Ruminococcus sp. 5_1_39BFAA TaxID=457412 RepID=UPI00356AB0EF
MEEIKKAPMTVLLMLVNVIVFLAVEITGGSQDTLHMVDCGAAFAPLIIENKEWYRLFTCMFLHFGMSHLANNMLVLFVLGQRLEPVAGKVRLLLIYILGGVGGNIFSFFLDLEKGDYAVSAGASGAVFAVMGAMIYVLVRNRGRVQDLSARQILIMAAFSLYFGFTSSGVDNAAHVGGMICGFLIAVLVYHPGRIYPRKIRNAEP